MLSLALTNILLHQQGILSLQTDPHEQHVHS